MRAYALMRHARDLETVYTTSPFWERYGDVVRALRSAVTFDAFAAYRGIGRYPLSEWPKGEPGWQWDQEPGDDPEPEARSELKHVLGAPIDYFAQCPRSFVGRLAYVNRVLAALRAPERYEVVELCMHPRRPRRLLGFDVGYWGGGNFSILCDALIWPIWHPPTVDAFDELARFARGLNEHALFPTERDAQRYLEWYREEEWAEQEPDDGFDIVSVGAG